MVKRREIFPGLRNWYGTKSEREQPLGIILSLKHLRNFWIVVTPHERRGGELHGRGAFWKGGFLEGGKLYGGGLRKMTSRFCVSYTILNFTVKDILPFLTVHFRHHVWFSSTWKVLISCVIATVDLKNKVRYFIRRKSSVTGHGGSSMCLYNPVSDRDLILDALCSCPSTILQWRKSTFSYTQPSRENIKLRALPNAGYCRAANGFMLRGFRLILSVHPPTTQFNTVY